MDAFGKCYKPPRTIFGRAYVQLRCKIAWRIAEWIRLSRTFTKEQCRCPDCGIDLLNDYDDCIVALGIYIPILNHSIRTKLYCWECGMERYAKTRKGRREKIDY